jgi:RNA polymerase sigma factor (TIGR02999 family)
VTDLLRDLRAGDRNAIDRLIPIVYQHLRQLAAVQLAGERVESTLRPTALVNELYLKLIDQRRVDWRDRAHFFATSAILMRRLVLDHARRRIAKKRGGGEVHRLEGDVDAAVETPEAVLRINEALAALAAHDPEQARLVELKFFGGLTFEEIAEVLGVSVSTAKREWAMARAWLRVALEG